MKGIDFQPPRLLRNPHVQSVLASSALRRSLSRRRAVDVESGAVEHVLDCGDGIRLQGFHTAQTAERQAHGLVALFHGWEGSARSNYVLDTGAHLLREGFDIFRLNFRDHGDTHHLNKAIFHSCRIDEVVGAVRAVANRFEPRALGVGGFSLGGNFALRVALRAPAAGIALRYAFAVCPVVSPNAGLFGLESGPWFYERYFLHKWTRSLRRKQQLFPGEELFSPDELKDNLRGLTRTLVQRHTDFGTLENYLDGYSIAGATLASLAVPATILTSQDDPVIPVEDFRALDLPATVELDIARYGGHCGFIRNFALSSFTAEYIAERVVAQLCGDRDRAEPARAAAA